MESFHLPLVREEELISERMILNGGPKHGYIDDPYPCGLFTERKLYDIFFGKSQCRARVRSLTTVNDGSQIQSQIQIYNNKNNYIYNYNAHAPRPEARKDGRKKSFLEGIYDQDSQYERG